MAKGMKVIALVSTLLTVLCMILYRCLQIELFFPLMITCGTTAYHFVMRLLAGWAINGMLHNQVDYRAKWFQISAAERKIYNRLKVKKWKGKMPTYDPDCFDPGLHSWDEIAQAMCQAELVHEVIMVLSFVPIFAAIPFGELWVFVITSVLAACFDGMFVIMQRYNRPRILRLQCIGLKAGRSGVMEE